MPLAKASLSASFDNLLVSLRKGSRVVVLVVYVDDIIISEDDATEIVEVKAYLDQHFQMKDLGALRYFVGIEVLRSTKGISLSQRKYVLSLLSETSMLAFKPINTPMDLCQKFEIHDDEEFDDKHWYRRRSTIGYCTFIGGNLVIWRSKKQTTVARSSAEAEYQAMAHTAAELM
ncbi:uncharacterized mitochondrial protein AtMg00810-like [Telopea speciosissima]|uniref:uncharacterized mitochondrial protein AtMg00810-like n=1 Tax=Telopea speciosissima TaxID=54955 RepID=UPI001CC33557|nr:uncharacterized mitochondrial protein AtMg00810-like [Telopea speciosissima]